MKVKVLPLVRKNRNFWKEPILPFNDPPSFIISYSGNLNISHIVIHFIIDNLHVCIMKIIGIFKILLYFKIFSQTRTFSMSFDSYSLILLSSIDIYVLWKWSTYFFVFDKFWELLKFIVWVKKRNIIYFGC